MVHEVGIFEQGNWIFTHAFSYILAVIKVQFSKKLRNFKRIEKCLKNINHPDLFDV